jgi:predicted nucleic-acid-binding protein
VIGLDTNILIRYLTLDDPVQSPRAVQIVESELSEDDPGFVSAVVLAEVVWVLRRSYRQDRLAIVAVVEGMLRSDRLRLEHSRAVAVALSAMIEDDADFADALIGALAIDAGCARTLTFDRRAARMAGFELV